MHFTAWVKSHTGRWCGPRMEVEVFHATKLDAPFCGGRGARDRSCPVQITACTNVYVCSFFLTEAAAAAATVSEIKSTFHTEHVSVCNHHPKLCECVRERELSTYWWDLMNACAGMLAVIVICSTLSHRGCMKYDCPIRFPEQLSNNSLRQI